MFKIYKPKYVYTNDTFYENYGVAVSGNEIVKIAPFEELKDTYDTYEEEIWTDLIMVPGTVNIHNHCFQSLLRGLVCDRPFLEWRDNALYKYSRRFTREHIYGGAVFAFSEMMKYGVTTVSDFFYLHNFGPESDEIIIKAAKDVGIRLVLARTMYDWEGAPKGYVESVSQAVENTRYIAKKYNNTDGMVKVLPAPHSLHAATPEMVQAGHALAKELGTGFHIHVAEEMFEVNEVKAAFGGLTPVELLDKLGVVDERMTIVHGVWLKPSEIELLGERGASLAYCPSSNMFLADGITDIPAMLKNNVTIGLGSDGACSNNRISVFEEMRMVALLQKANTCDALSLNYKDSFKMGTENGGRILGMPIGKIEEGYKADFVGIKIKDMSMQPISKSGEQLMPNIVYSMQPTAIAKVVVDGKLTVNKGGNLTISEGEVIEKVQKIMSEIGGE
jgi:5-methylthioadenosine/S-adenosylhomocysteine deaminase